MDSRLMRRPERLYYDSLWAQALSIDYWGDHDEDYDIIVIPDPSALRFEEVVRVAASYDMDLDLPRGLITDVNVCRAYLEERGLLPDDASDEDVYQAMEDAWENGDLVFIAQTYQEYFSENPDSITPVHSCCWPIALGYSSESPECYQAILDAYAGACVLMRHGDATYLNLAGGGMDLTWDLCRGYALCGCCVPIELAQRLPRDRKLSQLDEWVLQCCLHSLQSASESLSRWHKRTGDLYEELLREQYNTVIPDNLPLEAVLDFANENDRNDLRDLVEEPLRYMGRLPQQYAV